jgi:hypothetical protein
VQEVKPMDRTIRQTIMIRVIRRAAAIFWLIDPTGTAIAGQIRVMPSDGIEFDGNVNSA